MSKGMSKYKMVLGNIALLVLGAFLLVYMYLLFSMRLIFPVWIFVGLELLGVVALGLLVKLVWDQSRKSSG